MSDLALQAVATRNEKLVLAIIVVIAIALRIGLGLLHPFSFPDSGDYDALARTIVEHRAYQVNGLYATRMPGYPAFVAAIYFVCGYSSTAVLIVQALLGGEIVWLTYLVARLAVRGGGVLPLIAAGLAALDPLSIAFSASLLSEAPFTLCLMGGMYCCLKLLERPRIMYWLAIAALWAIAVELRASVFWCIVPLGAVLIVQAKTWRARFLHLAGLVIVLLTLFASLLPWQERNDRVFEFGIVTHHENGHHVRFTTLEGISLYEAVYPDATGGPKQDVIPLPMEMKLLNEAQRNDEWSRRAWDYIRHEPGRMAVLAIKKIGRTWSPFLNAAEFRNGWVQAGLATWHVPLFLLAAVGLIRSILPLNVKALLLAPMVYFTAVHAIFLGSVRYRVPLAPLLCILAAAGIAQLLQYGKRKPLVEV